MIDLMIAPLIAVSDVPYELKADYIQHTLLKMTQKLTSGVSGTQQEVFISDKIWSRMKLAVAAACYGSPYDQRVSEW